MSIRFNPNFLLSKLQEGDSETLAQEMLALLQHFETEPVVEWTADVATLLNLVCKLFLHIIAADNFAIPDRLVPEFIRLNTTLANMVHLSDTCSADLFLKKVLEQPENLSKILALYSHYSTLSIDVGAIFTADPYLASLWVSAILKSRWKSTPQAHDFISGLLAHPALSQFVLSDTRYPVAEEPCFAYFDATYANPDHDRSFRDIINAQVQREFSYTYHNTAPDFKRILFVSAFLHKGHPVYRCLAPLIASLKPHYHVALLYLGVENHDKLDHELFDKIHTTGAKDYSSSFTHQQLEKILKKNYGIAIITDIGLSRPSLILANMRFAPIQITTYGHPVTSGKTKIDYFIGGSEVEPQQNPERNFAETLILMPGLGVEPIKLDYVPSFPALERELLIIGLSWGELKFTHPHLARLKQIQQQAKRRIRFHVLGISPQRFAYLAAKKDLEEFFGAENIKVFPTLDNKDYMLALENCHLLLDSHPFGSYNRVVDSLLCKKPMISLAGEKSYQRFAAALLRQCGLDALVTETPEQFIALTLQWIDDSNFRREIAEKLFELDLEKCLFDTNNAHYFKGAIDYIIRHFVDKNTDQFFVNKF